jgi:hypothetical protein
MICLAKTDRKVDRLVRTDSKRGSGDAAEPGGSYLVAGLLHAPGVSGKSRNECHVPENRRPEQGVISVLRGLQCDDQAFLSLLRVLHVKEFDAPVQEEGHGPGLNANRAYRH